MYTQSQMIQIVAQHFSINEEKSAKLVERYLCAIRQQLMSNPMPVNVLGHRRFFLRKAHKDSGEVVVEKQRYYVWPELNNLLGIVLVVQTGNNVNGEETMVKIDDRYIDMLLSTDDVAEIVSLWAADLVNNEPIMVPVDLNSLKNFIDHCNDILKDGKMDHRYLSRVATNLRNARQIYLVASKMGGWPHWENPSEYGRVYYSGINVQNVHKELRRAALGDHWSYDLVCAAYGIRLQVALSFLQGDLKGHLCHTKEYVCERDRIRRTLAKLLQKTPNPEKIVKQVMNAVGFGANPHDGAYEDENGDWHRTAIRDIIRNDEDRARFLSDRWVQEFMNEQKVINQLIYDNYYATDPEAWKNRLQNVSNMWSKSGKLRIANFIAFVYQSVERGMMEEVFGDQEVIARIHDCVITKKPLDVVEIRRRLSKDYGEYMRIEAEYVRGYNVNLEVQKLLKLEEAEHRERIRMEEQQAGSGLPYVPSWIGNVDDDDLERQIEKYVNHQWLDNLQLKSTIE